MTRSVNIPKLQHSIPPTLHKLRFNGYRMTIEWLNGAARQKLFYSVRLRIYSVVLCETKGDNVSMAHRAEGRASWSILSEMTIWHHSFPIPQSTFQNEWPSVRICVIICGNLCNSGGQMWHSAWGIGQSEEHREAFCHFDRVPIWWLNFDGTREKS